MTVPQLVVLYFVVGIGCGGTVLWRARHRALHAVPSAVAAVIVWPLWVPFAMSGSPSTTSATTPSSAGAPVSAQRIASRIRNRLTELRTDSAHDLISEADATAIGTCVDRGLERLQQMDQQLGQRHGERERLDERLATLPSAGSGERARATVTRHARALERLRTLRQQEEAALSELADVIDLMVVQVALARFGDSQSLDELHRELWLRVEAPEEVRSLA